MKNKIIRVVVLLVVNNLLSFTRFFRTKRILLRLAGIEVGKGSKVVGPIKIGGISRMSIGNECWIGSDLFVRGNGNVIIGNNCDISDGVSFVTGGHLIGKNERRAGEGFNRDICIGDGVWVGANVTMLGGSQIYNGSIVGACSLVIDEVAANTLVVGVPAKVKRILVDV